MDVEDLWRPEPPVGPDGAPHLVLLHGFTQTAASWDPLVAALARTHRVHRVDLPGHGRSARIRLDLTGIASALARPHGTHQPNPPGNTPAPNPPDQGGQGGRHNHQIPPDHAPTSTPPDPSGTDLTTEAAAWADLDVGPREPSGSCANPTGPGGRATYVGYSLGGRVALRLALDHPEVVERLVLVGATAGIDDPAERAARRAHDEDLARSLERDGVDAFLDRWLAQPLFAALTPERAGREARRTNTAAGLAASLRLCGTGTMDPPWWDELPGLGAAGVPVTVVAGEADAKFTALGRRLAHGIGRTASFVPVPGAGHACHLEQPDAFLAAAGLIPS